MKICMYKKTYSLQDINYQFWLFTKYMNVDE